VKRTKTNSYIYFGLLLLLGCQPIFLFSQDYGKEKIDSTITAVKNSDDERKRELYSELGNNLLLKNSPDEATKLFKYFFSRDTTSFAKLFMYEAYSKNLSRRGNLDEAIAIKKKGIQLAEKLNNLKMYLFYNTSLAFSYDQKNKPDIALEYLNKIELNLLDDNDPIYKADFYHAKAAIYNSLKDFEAQEKYLLLMYEAVKEMPNTSKKRFHIYLVLDFYTQVNNPSQLTKFTEILSRHYEEAQTNIPAGHMPIASLFKRRLNKENIPVVLEAIKISDSLKSMNSLASTTIALATIYQANGTPEKAIPYLKKAAKTLKTVEKPSQLIDIYVTLAAMSAATNNYKNAYNYKILQASLQDSVTSEKMKRNIAALEIEFETEKKERKILAQQLELEKEKREKNKIRYGLIALGIVAAIVFLFFRNRLIYQKTIAKQTQAIQQQKITQLQQKNKLLALTSMIEGQEAERLRIAKDLHDSLGGLLSTVKAHFTTIQNEVDQLIELNLTQKTNSLLDEACGEVRRISHNMMPHALSISGLEGAIEDLATHLNEQGYSTTVEIKNLPDEIEATKKVMIYRLIQELISNIRKHANAKHILIQLMGHKQEVNLLIEDDGKGFNFEEAHSKGGLGLKSINSRVAYLDGTIDWDTQPNNGTSITINIPLL